jgi:hypothetical protein
VVGGNSLYAISITNQVAIENSYVLGNEVVHAVEPGFSKHGGNSDGVYVYSWNEGKGYRKRFFNAKAVIVDNWWTFMTSSLATVLLDNRNVKLLSKSVLKIVITEIIGVLILPTLDEICLINLSTMQPMKNSICKLSGWVVDKPSNIIVKYHINNNYDKDLFDSSV